MRITCAGAIFLKSHSSTSLITIKRKLPDTSQTHMKVRNLRLVCSLLLSLSLPLVAKAAASYTEALFTTNTLFIEAEDADFGAAQWVTTDPIGMTGPYPGGSYTNLGTSADLNIDWNATGPNGQVYRANTALSAGKEKGSGGSNRGTFNVTDWWTMGWNGVGDWENYTR